MWVSMSITDTGCFSSLSHIFNLVHNLSHEKNLRVPVNLRLILLEQSYHRINND